MIKESLKLVLIVTSINFTFTLHLQAQENNHRVNVLGEMRKVMWEGELDGVINLDTIRTKENVYGLTPAVRGKLQLEGSRHRSRKNGAVPAQKLEGCRTADFGGLGSFGAGAIVGDLPSNA